MESVRSFAKAKGFNFNFFIKIIVYFLIIPIKTNEQLEAVLSFIMNLTGRLLIKNIKF